jgi:hypothetical protein
MAMVLQIEEILIFMSFQNKAIFIIFGSCFMVGTNFFEKKLVVFF